MYEILIPIAIFAAGGLLFGVILAVASKIFAVRIDERVTKIDAALPHANCGGCGYSGCSAFAAAVVAGEAKPDGCNVGGAEVAAQIGEVMGVTVTAKRRMRAQVMCSGTDAYSQKKYAYNGAQDCIAAANLGGGDKVCPNGCIGLGTCAAACPSGAIVIVNRVAVVDYKKCGGCGVCVNACPKQIIKLIPFDSAHWVGCMSVDKGAVTRKYCDVGCISCKMCEKACPTGAITIKDFVASIDYDKCIGCDKCVEVCKRGIIWSAKKQESGFVFSFNASDNNKNNISRG